MSEARVVEFLGKPRLEDGESRHYPDRHLTVFIRDGVVIAVQLVGACSESDPFKENLEWAESLRTAEGIGLRSGVDQVKRAFGAPDSERRSEPEGMPAFSTLSYRRLGLQLMAVASGVCQITVLPPRFEPPDEKAAE